VQHLAFKIGSLEELEATKARLEAGGVEVIGITDHTIFKSIYFFDPNGHRLELVADTATPEMNAKLDAVKWDMLERMGEDPPGAETRGLDARTNLPVAEGIHAEGAGH
jgi:catechol-2,3-dioxygenase